jgi:hypothetical protein
MPSNLPTNEDLQGSQSSSNPLWTLEQNGYNVSNFVYPIDLTTDPGENHMIVFYINETDTTQYKTKPNPNGGQFSGTTMGNAGVPQVSSRGTISETNFQRNSSIAVHTSRVSTCITLYIPNNLQTTNSTQWDVQEFGTMGGIAQALGGANPSLTRSLKALAIGSISNLLKNVGDMASNATGNSQSDLLAATQYGIRVIQNPHMEVLFRGIDFRTFNFEFKFAPRSQQEAMCVSNIIKAFKFYSAPEVKHGVDEERFYIYPAEFDLEFWSGGQQNTFINKISTCACTNVSVNYADSGIWSAFRPGAIIGMGVQTGLSLTFKELEIITRERVLSGY